MELRFYDYELEPVKFHPYTSRTKERIFGISYSTKNQEVVSYREYLIDIFNEAGIKCYVDNKIVFECRMHGKKICFGFYDGNFTIGFDYYDENEN